MKETETKKPPVKKDPVKKAELKVKIVKQEFALCEAPIAQLYAKVNKVAMEIGILKKDGENVESDYRYVTAEAINAKVRELTAKFGLAIAMEVLDLKDEKFEVFDGQDNTIMIRTTATMRFKVIDLETGYSEEHRWKGTAQDLGGKSAAQAITECKKRFNLNEFKISAGKSDPEGTDPDNTTVKATPAVKAKSNTEPISAEEKTNLYTDAIEEIKQEYLKEKLGAEFTAGYKSLGYKGVGELYAETVKVKRDHNYRELQKNLEIFKSAEKDETQADHFDYHAELTRVKEAFEKEQWDLEGYTNTHLKKNWIDLPQEQVLSEQLRIVKFFNTVIAKGSK